MGVKITGLKSVDKLLDTLVVQVEGDKKTFRGIGNYLEKKYQENFSRAGSPSGGWAPLSASTRKDKIAKGYIGQGPLVRTGKLRDDTSQRVRPQSVKFSYDSKYAVYHQTGTSKMPKRKIIYKNKKLEEGIMEVFTKPIEKILKKL